MFSLANYFSRLFDGQNSDGSARSGAAYIAKRYAELLFRGKQFVESAEANEAQGITYSRLGEVGDGAFGPISLREGGTVIIDQGAGTVRVSDSKVWAGGYMHRVPDSTVAGVAMVGTAVIGIAVTEVPVTDVEDPELKGIVPNTESQGEALAARLRYDAVWAKDGDPFYPVFTIVDGVLQNEVLAPQDSSAELAVERHIRQTHGSHIVDGFRVSPGGFDDATDEQTLIISAGTLRAEGREVRRSVDQRFRRVENPTLVQVNGEAQVYPAGGVVTLNHGPIDSVQTVTVIKEVTRTITHQLAGGTDALPDTPVYTIQSVAQGGTTFNETTSWTKQGDGISWAPAGAEPSPGSSYDVTYRYVATVTPQAVGRQTLTLESAVVGQPVTVQYRWKLPRVDVLAIDLDGAVVYLEGLSSRYNAVPPSVPLPLAPLARVENRWGIHPVITDVDQRKITEAETRAMLRTLIDNADLISQLRMLLTIQERDPASRRGSFVDPFTSDLQRDLGITQDAAIVGGILQLPIAVTPVTVDIGSDAISLPFITEAVLSQPFRTADRVINKYLNFAPLPSPLELRPAVDRWDEQQSSSTSSSTSSFVQVNEYRPDLVGTDLYGTTSLSTSSSSSTSVSSSTQSMPFMRQLAVAFTCRMMGPGENLDTLTFDGIDVTASVTGTKIADAQGIMTGTFMIPANVRVGTKEVVVTGQGGSQGTTSFTGTHTLTVTSYHTSTSTVTVATTIDPVAQSFVLDEARQISGARVEFTARGDAGKAVAIELRALTGSTPDDLTLAEGSIPGNFTVSSPTVDQPSNWTEMAFRFPALVPANSYRAIALLTDDADHSVAVAQLGNQSDPDSPRGFDARRQEWIRRNPLNGDFFDGSNAKSWLLQPDTDLTCEIMARRYTSLSRTVVIGTFDLSAVDADGISDIMVLLIVEEPIPAARVRLELVRASGEVIAFEPNTHLPFDEYLTEEVTLRMVLTGTATLSPIVMPECQILWGRLKETARYVSEAVDLDQTNGALKVRTIVEVAAPGSSSVALSIGDEGAWTAQAATATKALGDDWIEREYLESPVADLETRQEIVLTGTPKFRPRVRQLRVRATEV